MALNALLAGAAVGRCLIPVFAWLSDRIGRRPILFLGSAGMALFGFAFFRMLDTGATPIVLAAVIIGPGAARRHVCAAGGVHRRAASPRGSAGSGASLAYQATSIFAGLARPDRCARALQGLPGRRQPIAIGSMLISGAICAFAALRARETKGMSFAQIDAETQVAS